MLGPLLWLASASAVPAAADAALDARPSVFEVRGAFVGGYGNVGFGGGIGLSADLWFLPPLGIGLGAGRLVQTDAAPLQDGTVSAVNFVGPHLSFRSAGAGDHFFATLGGSYAGVMREKLPGLCIDLGGGCSKPVVVNYSAWGVDVATGFLWQGKRAPVEAGPVLRFDLFRPSGDRPTDLLVTLGAEIGAFW